MAISAAGRVQNRPSKKFYKIEKLWLTDREKIAIIDESQENPRV